MQDQIRSKSDEQFPITIKGTTWKSCEHYIQAMKFEGRCKKLQDQIRKAPTTKKARKIGTNSRSAEFLRNDWNEVKEQVIISALLAKFETYEKEREILLSTAASHRPIERCLDLEMECQQQCLMIVREILLERQQQKNEQKPNNSNHCGDDEKEPRHEEEGGVLLRDDKKNDADDEKEQNKKSVSSREVGDLIIDQESNNKNTSGSNQGEEENNKTEKQPQQDQEKEKESESQKEEEEQEHIQVKSTNTQTPLSLTEKKALQKRKIIATRSRKSRIRRDIYIDVDGSSKIEKLGKGVVQTVGDKIVIPNEALTPQAKLVVKRNQFRRRFQNEDESNRDDTDSDEEITYASNEKSFHNNQFENNLSNYVKQSKEKNKEEKQKQKSHEEEMEELVLLSRDDCIVASKKYIEIFCQLTTAKATTTTGNELVVSRYFELIQRLKEILQGYASLETNEKILWEILSLIETIDNLTLIAFQ
jgi:hypothetical protein